MNLDVVKKHLNIDANYTGDDEYLGRLMQVAENAVKWQVDKEIETTPIEIEQAQLLLIGELYNNREITGNNDKQLPKNYDYLIGIHRNYTIR